MLNGTFELRRFQEKKGVLYAVGRLTGVLGTQLVNERVMLPVTSATNPPPEEAQGLMQPVPTPGACDILTLGLGPLDLDLLGLRVALDPVNLLIEAIPGAGNLLGNLLCGVAGLLDGGLGSGLGGLLAGLLDAIADLLNGLLGGCDPYLAGVSSAHAADDTSAITSATAAGWVNGPKWSSSLHHDQASGRQLLGDRGAIAAGADVSMRPLTIGDRDVQPGEQLERVVLAAAVERGRLRLASALQPHALGIGLEAVADVGVEGRRVERVQRWLRRVVGDRRLDRGNTSRRRRAPTAGELTWAGSPIVICGGGTIGSNSTRARNRPGWACAAMTSVAPPIEWPKPTNPSPSASATAVVSSP